MYKEEQLGKILDTFVLGGKLQQTNFLRAIKVSCYSNELFIIFKFSYANFSSSTTHRRRLDGRNAG